MLTLYEVKDIQTGEIVGTYIKRKTAQMRADLLDSRYGAIRYTVVFKNWVKSEKKDLTCGE
jgi:hypothetical protein